jgi:hypothetical protein
MAAGFTPQQGYMNVTSRQLAHADFTEPDQDTGEDHSAHAAGKTCAKCGDPLTATQPARRRGESDWVHDVCPRAPAESGE